MFILSEVVGDGDDGDVGDGEGEKDDEEVVGDEVEGLDHQVFHLEHSMGWILLKVKHRRSG